MILKQNPMSNLNPAPTINNTGCSSYGATMYPLGRWTWKSPSKKVVRTCHVLDRLAGDATPYRVDFKKLEHHFSTAHAEHIMNQILHKGPESTSQYGRQEAKQLLKPLKQVYRAACFAMGLRDSDLSARQLGISRLMRMILIGPPCRPPAQQGQLQSDQMRFFWVLRPFLQV